MKARIQLLLLIGILFAGVVFIALHLVSAQQQTSDVLSEERIRIEHESNIAYNHILNTSIDNYAGAYLNPEGRLVVMITATPDPEDAKAIHGKVKKTVLSDALLIGSRAFNRLSDAFKDAAYALYALSRVEDGTKMYFQEVVYSYSYLDSIKEEIGNLCSKHNNDKDSVWSQVSMIYVHVQENCIFIAIVNIDDLKIERILSEVGHAELLSFGNAEGLAVLATDDAG